MNKANTHILNICSNAKGSQGDEITLVLTGLRNCLKEQEARKGLPCAWQQGRCQNLQVAEQPPPSTQVARRGEKPQEGNSVIWSPPVGLWFVDHLWENHPEILQMYISLTYSRALITSEPFKVNFRDPHWTHCLWCSCTLKFLNNSLDESNSDRLILTWVPGLSPQLWDKLPPSAQPL